MATFFGGETFLGIALYTGSAQGIRYTVPAGRYAKVHLQRFSRGSDSNGTDSASISIGQSSQTYTGTAGASTSLIDVGASEIIITAGQTVNVSSNGPSVSYAFVVREFSAP